MVAHTNLHTDQFSDRWDCQMKWTNDATYWNHIKSFAAYTCDQEKHIRIKFDVLDSNFLKI